MGGIDDLNRTLGQMLEKASNMKPALQVIAVKQTSSFQQNFIEGGRPESWKVSKRVAKHGGQTLLISGRLMRSLLTPQVTNEGITFGSNLPYAAIHQYGGEINMPARSGLFLRDRITRGTRKGKFRKGTEAGRGSTRKGYTITMPARPSIVFQPQDIEDAGKILLGHLIG